tara:strand:- start:2048 stop:3271 length:1224 start_codon:yes stop_codon:yes gene_type:complete
MERIALLSFHGCPYAKIGDRDTGGMNIYVLKLAEELGRLGLIVDVFTRIHDMTDPVIVDISETARVIHLQAGPPDESKTKLHNHIPKFANALNHFTKTNKLKYDLIYSHYWLSGVVGNQQKTVWNVPNISTFHTLAKPKMAANESIVESQKRIIAEQQVLIGSDSVVVSTESEKQDIIKYYDLEGSKIHVIPAGVDLKLFRPLDKLECKNGLNITHKNVIISVAQRIEPLKGLDLLINALPYLKNLGDIKLLIVGGDQNSKDQIEYLMKLVSDLGLLDNVEFTGPVSQKDLVKYYNSSDVLVMPSHYETFGLAALEAQACGLPVIAAGIGGPEVFIQNGRNGYLVPNQEPMEYAKRINQIIQNNVESNIMALESRKTAETMSWESTAEKFINHCRSYSFKNPVTVQI